MRPRTRGSASRAWSNRAPGTDERTWLTAVPWGRVGRVDLDATAARWPRAICVSPHPDDETLAVGALLAELGQRGVRVDVVTVTDGEGSHPGSPILSPDQVRELRAGELDAALDALSVEPVFRRLGLPDGGLAADRTTVRTALRDVLADALGHGTAPLVIGPHAADGHGDHDIVGQVLTEVCSELGLDLVSYPVWMWHWATPADIDWTDTVAIAPSIAALGRKAAAVRFFTSQTSAFGRRAGDGPVLSAAILQRFERLVEMLDDPAHVLPLDGHTDGGRTAAEAFEAMFSPAAGASVDDPWGTDSRWYERRKRHLATAMLPQEELGRVLDLGCSTGALTVALAGRATAVTAVDGSSTALTVAARRTLGPGAAAIDWVHGQLPEVLDDLEGPYDTVVLSEVGYFLDGLTLLQVLAGMERLCAPEGVLVVVNWRHPTTGIPLDGRLVDRQVRSLWPTRARYEDVDVVIQVAGGHPEPKSEDQR